MSLARLLGLLVAVGSTLAGLLCIAPMVVYIDWISITIVVFGCAGLGLYTHDDLGWFCREALPRFVVLTKRRSSLGAEESLRAARIARTLGDHALIIASICTLIGGTQMLAGLTDPSQLGPALAVAFLTNLYSVLMVAFFFLPLNRFFVTEANTEFDGTLNPLVGVYAQILSTVVVLIPLGTVYLTWDA